MASLIRQQAMKAENIVCQLLLLQGWNILKQNFRVIGSEIDIIAAKKDTLIAVEVKWRTQVIEEMWYFESLLPHRKKLALQRGLLAFARKYHYPLKNCRCDLALLYPNHSQKKIMIRYLPNIPSPSG